MGKVSFYWICNGFDVDWNSEFATYAFSSKARIWFFHFDVLLTECGTQVFDSARCTCFTITVFLIELVKLSFDMWCCTCFTIRFPHLTNHIDLWRSSWCGYHNFSRSLLQKLSVMYCGIHCVKPGSILSYDQFFQCTWIFFLLPHAFADYRQPISLFLQLAFKAPE